MTDHSHQRGYPMRRFVGQPGVWVQRLRDWNRPVHVWLHKGAYRVICWPCMTPLQSGDDMYDNGWPSREAAMDVAHAHCASCVQTEAVSA